MFDKRDDFNLHLSWIETRLLEMTDIPPIVYHHKPPIDDTPSEKPKMGITGLQSGAFKSILAEMKAELSAAQTQGLADVKSAKDAAANEIKTTISGVKAKIESEISDALQEFAEFSNGGPA